MTGPPADEDDWREHQRRWVTAAGECEDQELWQSAVLGFAVIGSSEPVVQATLQKVVDFVDGMGLAQVRDSSSQVIHC